MGGLVDLLRTLLLLSTDSGHSSGEGHHAGTKGTRVSDWTDKPPAPAFWKGSKTYRAWGTFTWLSGDLGADLIEQQLSYPALASSVCTWFDLRPATSQYTHLLYPPQRVTILLCAASPFTRARRPVDFTEAGNLISGRIPSLLRFHTHPGRRGPEGSQSRIFALLLFTG